VLTVLIATRNGAATLPEVLAAHERLLPPAGGWKLVVVDNASEDGTDRVLRDFSARLPLTPLRLERPGQNFARNRGLAEAEGDLVVFTDDDAVPREDWLARLRSAADARPDFGIFAGAIRPRWPSPPEPWLLASVPLSVCYAITDPAWEEGPIKSDFAFSPNIAIRRAIFDAGHRFDEAIGPGPGSYPMGSETALTRRLHAAGVRTFHVPDAVVEHLIRGFQMTPEWILGRAIRYGRGRSRWPAADGKHRPGGMSGAARLCRGILGSTARIARARWRGDFAEELRRRWDRNCLVGALAETLRPSNRNGIPDPRTPSPRSP
jgi:glycosyltransferase involved in cell wall biosynthesis